VVRDEQEVEGIDEHVAHATVVNLCDQAGVTMTEVESAAMPGAEDKACALAAVRMTKEKGVQSYRRGKPSSLKGVRP
jgi:hypothetical protein